MNAESFLDDEDFRLITARAFDFMFKNELKRAMRSQNYVTLLTIRPTPLASGEHTQLTREVARLVSRQLRETDLLSQDRDDRLSVVLLDADHQSSLTVVDRLCPASSSTSLRCRRVLLSARLAARPTVLTPSICAARPTSIRSARTRRGRRTSRRQ